jgi:hypothetical protein
MSLFGILFLNNAILAAKICAKKGSLFDHTANSECTAINIKRKYKGSIARSPSVKIMLNMKIAIYIENNIIKFKTARLYGT